MRHNLVHGVYAALLTPRNRLGQVDACAFVRQIEFLLSHGVTGFAINGATGEFCLTAPAELELLLQLAQQAIGTAGRFVCGVGSTSWQQSLAGAHLAFKQGAVAVLLPTPYYFRYDQEDVQAYCVTVASAAPLPVLLYNLPQFSTAFETKTVLSLLTVHPNIIGIKDSSGSLNILAALTAEGNQTFRIVGSDQALTEARRQQYCDAVISGIACVMPELICRVFNQEEKAALYLEDVLQQIVDMPTPWALKWIAEARDICEATFAQPLSATRLEEGRSLQRWFVKTFPF